MKLLATAWITVLLGLLILGIIFKPVIVLIATVLLAGILCGLFFIFMIFAWTDSRNETFSTERRNLARKASIGLGWISLTLLVIVTTLIVYLLHIA